jgi:hypothetical protein
MMADCANYEAQLERELARLDMCRLNARQRVNRKALDEFEPVLPIDGVQQCQRQAPVVSRAKDLVYRCSHKAVAFEPCAVVPVSVLNAQIQPLVSCVEPESDILAIIVVRVEQDRFVQRSCV